MKTAELIMITKTGIVNVLEIEPSRGNNFIQLIWGNEITYKVINLNPDSKFEDLKSVKHSEPLKDYQAIYFNGVRLVKNGKLCK